MKSNWEKSVDFHGHECPGLAIGVRASEAAMEKLNLTFSEDEEVVCISENNACGVDAIQVLLGCSIGKGNLIIDLKGKQAFNFYDRNASKSIRVILKPFQQEMDRAERQQRILTDPLEALFEFKEPIMPVPEKAEIYQTITCHGCGEGTAEPFIRLKNDEKLCLDCYGEKSL